MNLYCVETKVNLLDKTQGDTFDFFTCLIIPAMSIKDAKNIASTYNILEGTEFKSIRNKPLSNFEINKSQEFNSESTYGQVKELSERNEDIFGNGHHVNFVTFTKLDEGIYKINS